jgi:hypothetical protein
MPLPKIITTVRVVLQEGSGEHFVVEREINCNTPGNPRFWTHTVQTELAAVAGTVVGQFVHQFGEIKEPKA